MLPTLDEILKCKELSREDLIALVNRLAAQSRKFGLVWEDKPEEVADMCKQELPVLDEVVERHIERQQKRIGEHTPPDSKRKGALLPDDGSNLPTHLIIEGDNYHALSVLHYTHAGKVDVIYIDPPYNTGNKDFIYNDRYVDKEDGYRHSKWLSFMEKRLVLAKNLLTDSGVIFISIDDNEQAHLRLLCDEVFGEENFVAIMPRSVGTVPRTTEGIQTRHDYVLVYANSSSFSIDIEIMEEHFNLDDNDGRGIYGLLHPLDTGTLGYVASLDYEIEFNGKRFIPGGHTKDKNKSKIWRYRWSPDLVQWGIAKNLLVEKGNRLYTKNYRNLKIEKTSTGYALVEKKVGKPFTSDTLMSENYGNRVATRELKELFPNGGFQYPKPVALIIKLIQMTKNNHNAMILDFFAGSGTTGHAVLELNASDGGNRQFILCTNNENGIAENVTYPRIKKVIEGYADKEGIPAEVRYFRTEFVEKDAEEGITDAERYELVNRAVDMLMIRENTFTLVERRAGRQPGSRKFEIYTNVAKTKYTTVIYDTSAIERVKAKIANIVGGSPVAIYIFTLGDDDYAHEFRNSNWSIEPLPERILQVYKRLFAELKKSN